MTTAVIVVDVQNDFCPGGSLAVAGGDAVAAAIAAHLRRPDEGGTSPGYGVVVATRDWHNPPPDTNDGHVAPSPDYVTTWPVHCVAGTPGAAYHPGLDLPAGTVHVLKGMGRQDYSGFSGEIAAGSPSAGGTLAAHLHDRGVTRVDVVGLATDHCVTATALDARAAGFAVRVLTDLTAGVAVPTTIAALTRLALAGVTLTTTQHSA